MSIFREGLGLDHFGPTRLLTGYFMFSHLVSRHLASELSVLKPILPGKFVARRFESGTIVIIVLSIKNFFLLDVSSLNDLIQDISCICFCADVCRNAIINFMGRSCTKLLNKRDFKRPYTVPYKLQLN